MAIKSKKFHKAVTFMELMVVIAIIGIMTAVGFVSLGSNKIQKEVEVAARQVAVSVREAQNSALTGKNASAVCKAYAFSYGTPDNKSYKVGCGGVDTVYQLQSGVFFNAEASFSFSIPFGALLSAPSPIILQKNSINYVVCVNSVGDVSDCSGSVCPCP